MTLDAIFESTMLAVRQLLNVDRVAIFKFDPAPSWAGEFIAEDIGEDVTSILTKRIQNSQFSEQFAASPDQDQVLATADIYAANLPADQLNILDQLQVRAHLVVPIVEGQHSWGLLCVQHCQFPRPWHSEEISFVRQIAKHFGIAVQQAKYIDKSTTQAEILVYKGDREQALTKAISAISQSFAIAELFQAVVNELRALLTADRVAVFQFAPNKHSEGKFVAENVADGWISVLSERLYDHCFGQQFADQHQQGQVQAISDIYAAGLNGYHTEILEELQVRAHLIVPILQNKTLWGLICIHQCDRERQWSIDDIKCAQYVAEHFSVALHQLQLLEQLRYQTEQQKSLTGVITRIRESLDLETIFQTTAQEVRQLLKADRVSIFFFQCEEDWEGQFVAEDRDEQVISVLAKKVHDQCFGTNYASLYKQGRIYISNDIYNSNLKDCHIQLLERFGIKASVVSPIINDSELWGLLCIHQCQHPRQWQSSEIEFISQIAKHLGVALEQWSQVEQLKLQASQLAYISSREQALEQQQLLAQTINAIRDSLQIEEIFETTTKSIQSLFKADRVAIYQFNADWSGQFVAESVAEGWPKLVNIQGIIQDTYLMETQGGRYAKHETWAIDDIYETDYEACHIALLEDFYVRAYAIVPIMEGSRLWGLLGVYQNSGPRHWETDELDFLTQVSTQLGVALNQAETVAQVRQQAAALQKATDRQRALSLTIDKIRQSLDIDVIFTTTTQEVRQLLEVDRVAIYRFNADWSGAFVADSIIDSWQPTVPTPPMIQDVFSQSDPNGLLPRNEMFVPISQGEKLWGLLMAYQTSKPRHWNDDEVGLLAQVGTQLGVALQQAELLKQTQQQTARLNQTLQTLKNTQARMVQGEKMAGLGQLAAGIAHEINNPVGFISSNLEPMQEYVTNLLEMLKLYQQQYPSPTAPVQKKLDNIEFEFIAEDLPRIMASMKIGASRIVDIVKSMQIFSRVDESTVKDVDIHLGLDSTLLILRHRLNAGKQYPAINIVKSYGDLPLIQCYASHLNQVFMNILVNAVDAFEEQHWSIDQIPEIQISTRYQQKTASVVVEFSDNGPGISEAALANIFNPFFTTKPVGKGTGLGLSISYQIVTEMHKGKLTCQSIPGKGTIFLVEIPTAVPQINPHKPTS